MKSNRTYIFGPLSGYCSHLKFPPIDISAGLFVFNKQLNEYFVVSDARYIEMLEALQNDLHITVLDYHDHHQISKLYEWIAGQRTQTDFIGVPYSFGSDELDKVFNEIKSLNPNILLEPVSFSTEPLRPMVVGTSDVKSAAEADAATWAKTQLVCQEIRNFLKLKGFQSAIICDSQLFSEITCIIDAGNGYENTLQVCLYIDKDELYIFNRILHELYGEYLAGIGIASNSKKAIKNFDCVIGNSFGADPNQLMPNAPIYNVPQSVWSAGAIRSENQIQQLSKCYIRDARVNIDVMSRYISGDFDGLTELEVAGYIAKKRKEYSPRLYINESFATTVACGANASMPHYNTSDEIVMSGIEGQCILIDSGGHYLDGTSDITLSMAIKPSNSYLSSYASVLQASASLQTGKFPSGIKGYSIDAIGRSKMWMNSLDYEHGTGHGIGFGHSVHLFNLRITKFSGSALFFPGMVVSNEPGFYKPGDFGIRVENTLLVVDYGSICGFEELSRVPIFLPANIQAFCDEGTLNYIKTANRKKMDDVESVYGGSQDLEIIESYVL